jgi:transcription initiation factor TFIIIB Brf1 subunit/transcription initiation factor TFIIB
MSKNKHFEVTQKELAQAAGITEKTLQNSLTVFIEMSRILEAEAREN